MELRYPSSSTNELIHIAKQALNSIFKDGYRYKKAMVVLNDIRESAPVQFDLFNPQLRDTKRDHKLMDAYDLINRRMGSRTIQFAAEGISNFQRQRTVWQMNRNHLSPRATTRWEELKRVG